MKTENEQSRAAEKIIKDAPQDSAAEANTDVLKACYYCGKKVSSDAPRCDVCGNNRCFTWTNAS